MCLSYWFSISGEPLERGKYLTVSNDRKIILCGLYAWSNQFRISCSFQHEKGNTHGKISYTGKRWSMRSISEWQQYSLFFFSRCDRKHISPDPDPQKAPPPSSSSHTPDLRGISHSTVCYISDPAWKFSPRMMCVGAGRTASGGAGHRCHHSRHCWSTSPLRRCSPGIESWWVYCGLMYIGHYGLTTRSWFAPAAAT